MRPEQLTGFDLGAMREVLGRPWSKAMEEMDELAMYAYVWRVEQRKKHRPEGGKAPSWDEVKMRPLEAIVEAFEAHTTEDEDPTTAGSGETSPSSVASGE